MAWNELASYGLTVSTNHNLIWTSQQASVRGNEGEKSELHKKWSGTMAYCEHASSKTGDHDYFAPHPVLLLLLLLSPVAQLCVQLWFGLAVHPNTGLWSVSLQTSHQLQTSFVLRFTVHGLSRESPTVSPGVDKMLNPAGQGEGDLGPQLLHSYWQHRPWTGNWRHGATVVPVLSIWPSSDSDVLLGPLSVLQWDTEEHYFISSAM